MIYFAVIKSKTYLNINQLDYVKKGENESEFQIPFNDFSKVSWESLDESLKVILWIQKNQNFNNKYYYFDDFKNNCFSFFLGWLGEFSDRLPTKLEDFYYLFNKENSLSGEYGFGKINEDGTGFYARNMAGSIQTYLGSNDDVFILTNRLSIGQILLGKEIAPTEFDPEFLAYSFSTSWSLSNNSLYRSFKLVEPGEGVEIYKRSIEIKKRKSEFLFDEDLFRTYKNDKNRYWDECYEGLIHNLKILLNSFPQEFSFPLSGGKDSRLLIGLLKGAGRLDHVKDIFTNGPSYSGEVISASLVTEYLNLPHRVITSGYLGLRVDNLLGKHFFNTEGEVSPMDLSWNTNVRKGMVLRGQESGLRNIATTVDYDEIKNWFNRHFAGFDIVNFLKTEWKKKLRHNFETYFAIEKSRVKELNNLPTQQRVLTRFARWGARIWSVHNTNEFSPFIFLDENIIKHTYNAGANSRTEEEFHFEMIKRSDKGLLEIPFFNQDWDKKYGIETKKIKHLYSTSAPMRGTRAVMYKNWELVKQIILESSPVVSNIIEMNNLNRMKQSDLKSGHYQPLWHLLLFSILTQQKSLYELKNIDLDIPILEDKKGQKDDHVMTGQKSV
jgi:hypothetical protein